MDFNKEEQAVRPFYIIKAILIAEQRLTTLKKKFPTFSISMTRMDNGKALDLSVVHRDAKEHNITVDTDLDILGVIG